MTIKSDIEIARAATMKPIAEVAAKVAIPAEALVPYGTTKAKITFEHIDSLKNAKDGKLILVTAISPTPAGEGKTTTTVGLGDGLNRIGKKAMMCLREPSLGPCFGVKGGAAGGGYAQVVPMEDINLHFTGDFHAITSAHNLLSAMIDNHIYWGNSLGFDTRRVAWKRVLDMNDRALREIVNSLGGVANGFPRQDGFDITVASEVMAILCLSLDLKDLERRLGNIIVGYTRDKTPIRARELKADGAMTVLLKDALMPNLVQTLENNPVFIHGGPFANIAHGCNSVLATKSALKIADYVVTEAGFGADLGAEKFFDIKCRKAGPRTGCGGRRRHRARAEDARRRLQGEPQERERSRREQGLREPQAPPAEHGQVRRAGGGRHQQLRHRHRRRDAGSDEGRREPRRARLRVHALGGRRRRHRAARSSRRRADRDDALQLQAALSRRHVAARQGEDDRHRDLRRLRHRLRCRRSKRRSRISRPAASATCRCAWRRRSTRSRPTPPSAARRRGHIVPVRELRLSAGAEFVVVVTGEIMTMPGLPRVPGVRGDPPQRRGPDRRSVLTERS